MSFSSVEHVKVKFSTMFMPLFSIQCNSTFMSWFWSNDTIYKTFNNANIKQEQNIFTAHFFPHDKLQYHHNSQVKFEVISLMTPAIELHLMIMSSSIIWDDLKRILCINVSKNIWLCIQRVINVLIWLVTKKKRHHYIT